MKRITNSLVQVQINRYVLLCAEEKQTKEYHHMAYVGEREEAGL